MKSKSILLLFSVVLTLDGCTKTDWQELFNVKDFTGFVQMGG